MFDIYINEISLRTVGLRVEKRPPIPTTKYKYITKERQSTNGNDYEKVGMEDNVIPISFAILDRKNLIQATRKAIKLLSEAETLIYSSDPGVFYKVKQVKSEDIAVNLRVLGRFNTEFTLAPGSYLMEGKEKMILTEKTVIENMGDVFSEPIITIYGSGDINLFIGQQVIKLTGINDYITLDTPLLEAYKGVDLANKKVNGELPIFQEGVFNVSWSGNVSKLEIIPNWRCI